MRYLTIISFTLLLSACGNKLSTLKLTTEKVSNAVSTCTEAAKTVCTELDKVTQPEIITEGSDIDHISNSWDTHMMLW